MRFYFAIRIGRWILSSRGLYVLRQTHSRGRAGTGFPRLGSDNKWMQWERVL